MSPGSRTLVSIVVVTHEHEHDLPKCLEALERARRSIDSELILIDNRSNDRSFALASELAPAGSTLVRNQRRQGFAANANYGISLARGQMILLLNPDTAVTQDSISRLVEYLRSHPETGIVAPALYFTDGTLQPSRRRFPTWRSFIARRTPLRRWLGEGGANRDHLMLDVPATEPQEIDWALAACWLVNRVALEEVGSFDEGYPLYVEDIDLCLRMHQCGWKVIYLPSATVIHRHLAVTDRRWLTWRTLAHARGMTRFVRKHGLRRPPPPDQ